jgi:hypothetical protein
MSRDKELNEVVSRLLEYSFEDIKYQFDGLTKQEKSIFGDEKTFEEVLQKFNVRR